MLPVYCPVLAFLWHNRGRQGSRGQAQLADLEPGDIIQAVNNMPIAVLSSLQEMIDAFKRGDAVGLQIERDGRLQYIAFEMV
jgi:S1-C subfamily serine protease